MSKSMTQPVATGDARGHALVTLDGRYHVLQRIAAGGMGEVYRAHDAVLAREVAVKVLHRSLSGDPGFVERFRREARAAATLNHPNIVSVYDWGAVDGVYYMVMEYVHGRSVREILNTHGRLTPSQAVDVVRQSLSALEHAHSRGIVHRDLKPENILLTEDGVVKLTDLGLARAFADARSTHAGTVTGTVQYLAPEQIRGEPADPRSDLYALGIVTFELLTDRLPFSGETPMSIAYKHLSDPVPAPSSVADGIGPEFDAFVAAAVDKDREMRPESASVMREDLERIAEGLRPSRSLASVVRDLPEVAREATTNEPPAPMSTTATIPKADPERNSRWRRPLLALLALMAVAAAAWGVWTYLIPKSHPVPVLAGYSVEDATAQLHALGFETRIARGRYDQLPEGSVVEVDPAEGFELREGETVTLIPSLGPPPVPVPDVIGEPVNAARDALRSAGFEVEVRHRYHATVPEGAVIARTPEVAEAPEGTAITLIVSDGHAPVEVPSVVGKTEAAAEQALRASGFRPVVVTAFSDDVERDRVIDVSPPEGESIDYRSSVTLTVSMGPERFPVPVLTGLSPQQAEARAASYGLRVEFFRIPGTAQTTVISQLPTAGTKVRYGDTITLYVA